MEGKKVSPATALTCDSTMCAVALWKKLQAKRYCCWIWFSPFCWENIGTREMRETEPDSIDSNSSSMKVFHLDFGLLIYIYHLTIHWNNFGIISLKNLLKVTLKRKHQDFKVFFKLGSALWWTKKSPPYLKSHTVSHSTAQSPLKVTGVLSTPDKNPSAITFNRHLITH